MRPPESFLGQPIRDLQSMLRVITRATGGKTTLVPDGIYGPETVSAVRKFQESHRLPATGITDLVTWEAILAEYIPADIQVSQPHPLHILLDSSIETGKCHPHLFLVQGMLTVLSRQFRSIPRPEFTGILDRSTAASLKAFQSLCRIECSGCMDKITWKYLALHYPLAAALQTRDGQKKTSRGE